VKSNKNTEMILKLLQRFISRVTTVSGYASNKNTEIAPKSFQNNVISHVTNHGNIYYYCGPPALTDPVNDEVSE